MAEEILRGGAKDLMGVELALSTPALPGGADLFDELMVGRIAEGVADRGRDIDPNDGDLETLPVKPRPELLLAFETAALDCGRLSSPSESVCGTPEFNVVSNTLRGLTLT